MSSLASHPPGSGAVRVLAPRASRAGYLARRAGPRPVLALVAIAALLRGGEVWADDAPQLEVTPRRLDFGKRGHMEKPSLELTVQNRGTAPLGIREMKPCCSSIRVAPPQMPVLAPGQSAKFTVTMSSGRAMGELSKYLTIRSNDPRRAAVRVPVRMSVHRGFRLRPLQFRINGAYGGDPVEVEIELKKVDLRAARERDGDDPGDGAAAIELTDLQIDGRFGRPGKEHLEVEVVDREDGKLLRLRLDPKHPEGRIAARLTAQLNGKPFVVPITGEMFAEIFVEPRFVNFSGASADEPASLVRDVVLRSIEDVQFEVTSVAAVPGRGKAPQPKLEFVVEQEEGGRQNRVRVRLQPVEPPGRQRSFYGKILVRTDHPEKPMIRLSYSGFFAR